MEMGITWSTHCHNFLGFAKRTSRSSCHFGVEPILSCEKAGLIPAILVIDRAVSTAWPDSVGSRPVET